MVRASVNHCCREEIQSLKDMSFGGESDHASFSVNAVGILTAEVFIKGSNLSTLIQTSKAVDHYITQTQEHPDSLIHLIIQRAISNLQEFPLGVNGFHCDDGWKIQLNHIQERQLNAVFCLYYITELQRLYLFEEYTSALAIALELQEKIQTLPDGLEVADYYFYSSLTLAELASKAETAETATSYRAILSQTIHRFKDWSEQNAESFCQKYLLLCAEMARLSGHVLEAMELYDQAIAAAQNNGFIQDQALGNELAAKLYLSLGRVKVAQTYLTDAYSVYEQWGAMAKVNRLDQQYPDLISKVIAELKTSQHLEKLLQTQIELTQAYSRFVPKEFLQFLGKTSIIDVELGDQIQLEMSVLFADIWDFTSLSEQMTPKENFKFINSYFSYMESAITENNGFIDKYIGDSIMALFNGEVNDSVNAAIAMIQRLTDYNQSRINLGQPQIKIGIGINTGSLMLGTVGGANRMDSTVISDAVNLSARIEKLTRDYEVTLLISQQTLTHLHNPEQYSIRMIDQVKVKGKSESVIVYEVFDADPPELRAGKLLTAELLTEALSLFNARRYREATRLLETCLDQNPHDKVARIYLERCLKSGLHLMQEL